MATKVGLLHLDVMLHDAATLKDKRRVVKSFKDRLAAGRNVSVAEVDHLDSVRRALLAVAMVGNDARYLDGALQQVVSAARANHAWAVLDWQIEFL
jgi:hypothetical protein